MVQNNSSVKSKMVLLLLDKPMHIREISRELKIPHTTIIRTANELYKDNVIDFEIIGKNKMILLKKNSFSSVAIFSAELEKLFELMQKNKEIAIVRQELLKVFSSSIVLLFGSFASGKYSKTSDIDVFIESDDYSAKKKAEELNSRLSIKLGQINKNDLLMKEIIKNHVILHGVEEFYDKIEFFKENN